MDFGFKTEYNGRLKKISSGTSQLNKNLITRRKREKEEEKKNEKKKKQRTKVNPVELLATDMTCLYLYLYIYIWTRGTFLWL